MRTSAAASSTISSRAASTSRSVRSATAEIATVLPSAEEVAHAELDLAPGQEAVGRAEVRAGHVVDAGDVVLVGEVERLDQERQLVRLADGEELLGAQVEAQIVVGAEVVARLREVALVDQPVAVAVDDAAGREGRAVAVAAHRPQTDLKRQLD